MAEEPKKKPEELIEFFRPARPPAELGPDVFDIAARVAWARGSEIGVQFVKLSHWARVMIAELIEASHRSLADTFEATHPRFCHCLEGSAVAEPPLPRSAHRQTGSRQV